VLGRLKGFVARWLLTHLQPLATDQILDFDQWIEECPYTESRKDELREIEQELHGHRPSFKQASKIKCFIKTEPYVPSLDKTQGVGVLKNGRLIMSRSDYAKVILGPLIKSIENAVYDLHRDDGGVYFIKHVPVPERYLHVQALRSDLDKFIVTDYTSFEASFSSEVMEAVECQLYRYMLQLRPQDADWACRVLTGNNHLVFRNSCSADIKGRRMSGDMCTSLGNGFTNLMLMHFAAEEFGFKVNGMVEGDDGIFALSDLPHGLSEFFASLGFVIKLQEISDPCIGGFCGIVAADNGNIKDPIRFLSSFGWTHTCIEAGDRVMSQLLRAKALSAQYELPNCPVLRVIADRALQLTTGVEPRFVLDGYHTAPVRPPPEFSPTPATRELFSELYGISPSLQLQLESRIRSSVELRWLDQYLTWDSLFLFLAPRFVGV